MVETKEKKWMFRSGVIVFMVSVILYGADHWPKKEIPTVELIKQNLYEKFQTEGIVKSAESKKVYASFDYVIQNVLVRAGEVVTEGQTLAVLDLDDLQFQIEKEKASLGEASQEIMAQIENETALYDETVAVFQNRGTPITPEEKETVEQQEEKLYNAKEALQKDADLLEIERLQKELEKATIVSPISGTVTGVYAQEGTEGKGLLFVVEDTKNLTIATSIGEAIAGKVRVGLPVGIRAQGIGENVYQGEIRQIAPTTQKDLEGNPMMSEPVLFETDVAVKSQDTQLKIGMKTTLEMVLEQKDNVFAVPKQSIGKNNKGESVLYILEGGKNNATIKEKVVQLGMQTAEAVEVLGDGLKEGTKVVRDAVQVEQLPK